MARSRSMSRGLLVGRWPRRAALRLALAYLAFIVSGLAWTASAGLTPGSLRTAVTPPAAADAADSILANHFLVTWYGNPHSPRMGVLGEATGDARASALRQQASEYKGLASSPIMMAYHLVAVVAQADAGADGMWRRRESADVIDSLLREAREYGFHLIVDVQPGRSPIEAELEYLRPFLEEPDVHLALDPEWAMAEGQVPGQQIGSIHARDVNTTLDFLERLIREHDLPRKVLIMHQFTLGMLPDKENIRRSPVVELVLMMDGIGTQALKRASYDAIMRQRQLDFPGIKLFYDEDTNLFSPEQVLALDPRPAVVIYQ